MTFPQYFDKLRLEVDLRPAEIARRAEISKSTLSKMQKGLITPSLKMVAKILTKGMGIAEGDRRYLDGIAIWSAEHASDRVEDSRSRKDMGRRFSAARSTADKARAKLHADLEALSKGLTSKQAQILSQALANPDAIKAWLLGVDSFLQKKR